MIKVKLVEDKDDQVKRAVNYTSRYHILAISYITPYYIIPNPTGRERDQWLFFGGEPTTYFAIIILLQ